MCVLKPVLLIFSPHFFSFDLNLRLSAETFFLIHESLQILSPLSLAQSCTWVNYFSPIHTSSSEFRALFAVCFLLANTFVFSPGQESHVKMSGYELPVNYLPPASHLGPPELPKAHPVKYQKSFWVMQDGQENTQVDSCLLPHS